MLISVIYSSDIYAQVQIFHSGLKDVKVKSATVSDGEMSYKNSRLRDPTSPGI